MSKKKPPTNNPQPTAESNGEKKRARRDIDTRIAEMKAKLQSLEDMKARGSLNGKPEGKKIGIVQKTIKIMTEYVEYDSRFSDAQDLLHEVCERIQEEAG